MTTPDTFPKTTQARKPFVFPDPPEDPEDKMTSFDRLAATGNVYHLIQHLGSPETTLVAGEHYLALAPTRSLAGVRYPDLLVAFGVDPAAYKASNAYVISEQSKPPDFVLEIASRSSGRIDVTDKRRDYAALHIGEYWRFDETGQHHGVRLAGERLVDGEYAAIDIEELPDGRLQGYSAALDLNLCWVGGELMFYDPATGRPIATLADERARADAAEARVRELEEQFRRQGP
jgi:Uma2 family endonuclease